MIVLPIAIPIHLQTMPSDITYLFLLLCGPHVLEALRDTQWWRGAEGKLSSPAECIT